MDDGGAATHGCDQNVKRQGIVRVKRLACIMQRFQIFWPQIEGRLEAKAAHGVVFQLDLTAPEFLKVPRFARGAARPVAFSLEILIVVIQKGVEQSGVAAERWPQLQTVVQCDVDWHKSQNKVRFQIPRWRHIFWRDQQDPAHHAACIERVALNHFGVNRNEAVSVLQNGMGRHVRHCLAQLVQDVLAKVVLAEINAFSHVARHDIRRVNCVCFYQFAHLHHHVGSSRKLVYRRCVENKDHFSSIVSRM